MVTDCGVGAIKVADSDSDGVKCVDEQLATYKGDSSGRQWTRWIPGYTTFRSLMKDYGFKFLLMISLTAHWGKGFGRAQCGQSVRYLLQNPWAVPGPQLDILATIVELPWSMKPIIALVSDMYPIFGYHKTPYILITGILGALGTCMAVFMSPDLSSVEVPVIGLFLTNLAWMTSDILVEGQYARRMMEKPQSGPELVVFIGVGQQVCVFLSSLISGFVIDNLGAQWNLIFCLIPTVLTCIVSVFNFLDEPRITSHFARFHILSKQRNVVFLSVIVGVASILFAVTGIVTSNHYIQFGISFSIFILTNAISWLSLNPLVGNLVLFLAIAGITNMSLAGPSHYFYTDTVVQYPDGPHFEPWFYVTICGIVGAIGSLIGCWIFSFFKSAKYITMFAWVFVFGAIIGSINSILFSRLNRVWGISDYAFVGSDTAIASAVTMLSFMPGFLLLSRVCPDKIESTTFAILASNTNFALSMASPISALICSGFGITPNGSLNESGKFENLWIANLVVSGIRLVPLAFLWLLPRATRMTDKLPVLDNIAEGSRL